MGHSISNAVPVIRSLPIDTQALGKAPVDSKQALSTGSVGPRLDAQVLQAGAAMTQSGHTVQQLDDMAEAAFTEAGDFLVDLAKQEQARQGLGDTAESSLMFDPGAFEKHLSVLVSALVALLIARQANAKLGGEFTQMAYKAAVAQGVAIKAGGEAAMRAAIGGAVVAGVMAVGGAGMQIRGHQLNHTDIKSNKIQSANNNLTLQEKRAELDNLPPTKAESSSKDITISKSPNQSEVVSTKDNDRKLKSNERTVLEAEIRKLVDETKHLDNTSAQAQKAIHSKQVVGSAISSVGHSLSAGVNTILRTEEYNQRQNETLHGAEQSVNKSVSDAANQMINEDSAMIAKQFEFLTQIIEIRSSTFNTAVNARA